MLPSESLSKLTHEFEEFEPVLSPEPKVLESDVEELTSLSESTIRIHCLTLTSFSAAYLMIHLSLFCCCPFAHSIVNQ